MTDHITHPDPDPVIVVGVDGSEESARALRWAARLATATSARLDVITAWQLPTGLGRDYIPYAMTSSEDMHKALTATVDRVLGDDRPARMRLLVREGNTADVLVRRGAEAIMIVVGSRGHGGFAGLYLGSVSAKVAEHAACPVLVVHGDKEAPHLAA